VNAYHILSGYMMIHFWMVLYRAARKKKKEEATK
jgi:hypothetical protein